MSSLFKPKISTPEPPAPPPTIDEAATAQDRADQLKRRKGRSSTILVPDAALPAKPAPATILGG